MNKQFLLIAVGLVVLGGVLGAIFGKLPQNMLAGPTTSTEKIAADYSEAVSVIDTNYILKVDHEKV
ncbi:MAG TPA: hypothetical protein VK612_07305, partial [Pyrinomonadaceae bacterium]|nr:hypothetical protein [Pyrinomonadaceae bacterium]